MRLQVIEDRHRDMALSALRRRVRKVGNRHEAGRLVKRRIVPVEDPGEMLQRHRRPSRAQPGLACPRIDTPPTLPAQDSAATKGGLPTNHRMLRDPTPTPERTRPGSGAVVDDDGIYAGQ